MRKVKKTLTTCLATDIGSDRKCGRAPTHGKPQERRCEEHHAQYCKMTGRYKEASKVVDQMETADIPTLAQIEAYDDLQLTKEKAKWMRQYIEAIRVEKLGREIHHKHFFLKVDDGHKMRIKLLAKKMVENIDIMDALEERVLDLQYAKDPAYDWIKKSRSESDQFQDSIPNDDRATTSTLSSILERLDVGVGKASEPGGVPPITGDSDDDPIELVMRARKNKYLKLFDFIREKRESWIKRHIPKNDHSDPGKLRVMNIQLDILHQYTRRVILYDSTLLLKAKDKVSFNDLFLDPDFTDEDCKRLVYGQIEKLQKSMIWWKDATLEALAMHGKSGTAANVGNPKDRFKIAGGWVFNNRHTGTMSSEAWWYLLLKLDPPADIENRFMYLCNSFDDLKTFLSLADSGLVPFPSFCVKNNAQEYRGPLSLCGVVIGDLVGTSMPGLRGPFPSRIPASRRDCITWAESENRAYTFGALRDEGDPFTDAFLKELRRHPDQFVVLTHSESDPDGHVERFGGGDHETFFQMRIRQFEAPMASMQNVPAGRGTWDVLRTSEDVLYGTGEPRTSGLPVPTIKGYLTELKTERNSGWLFWMKKDRFKVKYFVILDNVPNRDAKELLRDVAWAALCAAGHGQGSYTKRKFVLAVDALMKKTTPELFGFMEYDKIPGFIHEPVSERLKREGL